MKRKVWMWIVDMHNAWRQRRVIATQRKKPTVGYYAVYHGYWVATHNLKQNIEKCKTEKRTIANHKTQI